MSSNARPVTSRYSRELVPGDRFVSSGRTIGETDVTMFAALTGDWHPQHTDSAWAKGSIFGERVAPGLLALAVAAGLLHFDPECVVALRRLRDVVFKRPLRFGDTITAEVKVEEVSGAVAAYDIVTLLWRVRNQSRKTVMVARVEVLWKTGAPPQPPGDEDPVPGVVPL